MKMADAGDGGVDSPVSAIFIEGAPGNKALCLVMPCCSDRLLWLIAKPIEKENSQLESFPAQCGRVAYPVIAKARFFVDACEL